MQNSSALLIVLACCAGPLVLAAGVGLSLRVLRWVFRLCAGE